LVYSFLAQNIYSDSFTPDVLVSFIEQIKLGSISIDGTWKDILDAYIF